MYPTFYKNIIDNNTNKENYKETKKIKKLRKTETSKHLCKQIPLIDKLLKKMAY